MKDIEKTVQVRLFELQDMQYRDFHCRLMPTINPDTVIGVRVPELRKFAKAFAAEPEAAGFMQSLPHRYYEENNLHGILISSMKDYGQTTAALNAFLPYVDNWVTCDLMRPGVFKKHLPELLEQIKCWMASDKTYTIRFGIEMLMIFYLDDMFRPEYPEWVAEVHSGEYYVKMMIAWYFATALAKQYDAVLPFILEQRLDPWTHNKAIQKAIESRRITDEQKNRLRALKIR